LSILAKIGKGAAWSAVGQWGTQVLQLVVSIVVARILAPSDYGLVGMAAVFTNFTILFRNIGLGQALIQRDKIDDIYISTAFWATFAISFLVFGIAYLCAPLVGVFYEEPVIADIVRVSALGFILSAVSSTQTSLMTRSMAFKKLATSNFIASVGSSLTALGFAISGMGVWSLVIGGLVFNIFLIPLLYIHTKWSPMFKFSLSCFRDLFSFGGNILGFSILNYFNRNLDNFLVGKFLGVTALGYYELAYQFMLRPISQVSQVIGKPLFPALSFIQNDKKQSADIYRSVVIYISLITFPMMLGLAVIAPEFIVVVLGEKWALAIPVLQILCFAGLAQSIGTTVGNIYLAQNRPDIMLKWALVTTPILALAFIIGVQWGIVGVALSYTIVTYIFWGISHHIANRLISLTAKKFWGGMWPALRASAVMAIVLMLFKYVMLLYHFSSLHILGITIVAGIVIYTVMLCFERQPEIVKIRTYIKNIILKLV